MWYTKEFKDKLGLVDFMNKNNIVPQNYTIVFDSRYNIYCLIYYKQE